jgi:predicted metal-dependent peptidase
MGRSQGRKTSLKKTSTRSHDILFKETIEYLNEEFPFFLTHVLNIGKPSWTGSIDTAAVSLEKNGDFKFIFNPDFAKELTTEELGFVAAHETMHILLNHLQLAKNFQDHRLFNYAADAVINDYLADQGMDIPDGAVLGPDLIGEDCADLSVSEVYQRLEQEINGSGGDEGGDQKGDGQKEDGQEGSATSGIDLDDFKNFDDHGWIHDSDNHDVDTANDIFNQNQDTLSEQIEDMRDDQPNPGSFSMAKSNDDLSKWREDNSVSLAWEDLLKEIDPDILPDSLTGPPERPTFTRRPRSLSGFPETILPVTKKSEVDKAKNKDKPTIVMALDTSGSIGHEQAEKFITLAKSIPRDKVNLFTCTFTTNYLDLDLDNPQFRGGGTSFSAVEDFIQDKVIGQVPDGSKKPIKDYPKTVLVVTDGEANFYQSSKPSQSQLEENWHWLLTENYKMGYLKNRIYDNSNKIKKFFLNKFVK